MAAAKEPEIQSSFDLTSFLTPESSRKVPNHLLDTKIFAKLGENEVLQARPSSLHFNGFTVGKVHSRKLKIINAYAERQRMHIIPPTTQNFRIKYLKEDTLVPGLYLEVTVFFKGGEYQYYNDCIRIHSQANENLVVPLYAYPVMDLADFPKNLHFQPTPLGQRRTVVIPLKCTVQVDFEYKVSLIQRHSAFTIEPLSGYVPGGSKIDLKISFTPEEYCTAQMQFQLMVSQFNGKPLSCSVTGTCMPGLGKEQIMKQIQSDIDPPINGEGDVDPRALTPLNRSRNRKAERKKNGVINRNPAPKEIVQDGIRFPMNLNNPAAACYVLTQKPGKLKAKDLREVVKFRDKAPPSTKQMKEAVFEHLVNRNVTEEERNQLRWCVKLGEDLLSMKESEQILKERARAIEEYHVARGDPQLQTELNRSATFVNLSRIHRQAGEHPTVKPSFDFYANDVWDKRYSTLYTFIQAVRKIMIRKRVTSYTKSLAGYITDWRKGRFSVEHSRNLEEMDEEQQIISNMTTTIKPSSVTLFAFPEYIDPNVKDDMAVDALGPVILPATNVEVKTRVPYFGLKVPAQYKVLGYTPHGMPSSLYVPTGLPRPLRAGPDESKRDTTSPEKLDGNVPEEKKTTGTIDMAIMEQDEGMISDTGLPNQLDDPLSSTFEPYFKRAIQEFELVIPSALFKERQYPPLHIFNQEPGLMLHAPQLRHSETDEDHRLLPIPTGTDNRSSIKLDREDVIAGSMGWKRFPCQGIIALNNTPTMSSVFVPRWSDPFSSDMMQESTPEPLKELPEEDAPTEDDDVDSDATNPLVPTMEMVRAQFMIPDESIANPQDASDSFVVTGRLPSTNNPVGKTGPVPRTTKEKELEKYNQDKKNRLGQRIKANVDNLTSYTQLDRKGTGKLT